MDQLISHINNIMYL